MRGECIELAESAIKADWRGCVTADLLYDRDRDWWLEFDSWDKRSDGFDSLVLLTAWDYYAQDGSSCLIFDSQDRHIGAAWVESALATHKNGQLYVLVYVGFRTDIPWVKCPPNLNRTYAIPMAYYAEELFAPEVADAFATRLIDNVRDHQERGLTTE